MDSESLPSILCRTGLIGLSQLKKAHLDAPRWIDSHGEKEQSKTVPIRNHGRCVDWRWLVLIDCNVMQCYEMLCNVMQCYEMLCNVCFLETMSRFLMAMKVSGHCKLAMFDTSSRIETEKQVPLGTWDDPRSKSDFSRKYFHQQQHGGFHEWGHPME